jgi:DNA polymerase III subunit gamma/tau
MDNFLVSARKYRPDTFESVLGQKHITDTLKNAIKSKQVAQAFLFCGPRGVGKTTCARILAKTLNCENLNTELEACNQCVSCTTFNKGNSLNIYELDAASNNSVDDIRDLVEQVRYPPQYGTKKVYIIDEVHMLSTAAFNAFLKTLEEPPSYAIFILATTEKHKILPTILSRCQIFEFNRIQVKHIAQHLASIAQKEQIQADEKALDLIARKADGALRDALSIFDQVASFSNGAISLEGVQENLNILDLEYYFKLTQFAHDEQLSDALLLINDFIEKGFDVKQFLQGLMEHFRNLLVSSATQTLDLIDAHETIRAQYVDQAKKLSPAFIINGLNLSNQISSQMSSSNNQRLLIELLFIKLAHLKQWLEYNEKEPEKKKPEPAVKHAVAAQIIEPDRKLTKLNPNQKLSSLNKDFKLPSVHTLKTKVESNPKSEEAVKVSVEELHETPTQDVQVLESSSLNDLFNAFADQVQTSGKKGHAVLLRNLNPSQESYIIHVTVNSSVNESIIKEYQEQLMEFIRNSSKEPNLYLKINVDTSQQLDKIELYSNREKFEYLAQKNPALLELKNRFKIDL